MDARFDKVFDDWNMAKVVCMVWGAESVPGQEAKQRFYNTLQLMPEWEQLKFFKQLDEVKKRLEGGENKI